MLLSSAHATELFFCTLVDVESSSGGGPSTEQQKQQLGALVSDRVTEAVADWARNRGSGSGASVQSLLASLVRVLDEIDFSGCGSSIARPTQTRASQTTDADVAATATCETQTVRVERADVSVSAGCERCESFPREAQTNWAGVGTRWFSEAGAHYLNIENKLLQIVFFY